MLSITGLDFTVDTSLFRHIATREKELLLPSVKKMMKSVRCPFSLILTCDRAEVVSEGVVPSEILERALGVNPIAAAKCRYSFSGDEAVHHVFLLSAGMLSPLFGEDTVQGQINDGAAQSRLAGSASPYIDKLLNMAVAFSKRMHTEMRLRVFDSSVAEAVRRKVAGLHRVLIIGSGEGARLIASSLVGDHEVRMTLRDIDKTFLVPPGAVAVPYERRFDEALSSEAVISASSGLYFTLTEQECRALGDRMLFDLSLPPDLPPSVAAIRTSDLGVEEKAKDDVRHRVEAAAEEECRSFSEWAERSRIIGDAGMEAEAIAYEAMRRLSSAVSSLSLPAEKEIQLRASIIDSVRKASIAQKMRAHHAGDMV